MSIFGFGRKREETPEPDYAALIEAAEERARLATEAWAAEQDFEYEEDGEEGEETEEMVGYDVTLTFLGNLGRGFIESLRKP